MLVEGKRILIQVKRKNLGNVKLAKAIDQLIEDLEKAEVNSVADLKAIRKDAQQVHRSGFYFLDIHIHRTLVLIEFDDDSASIIWAGSHQEYERTFKNNKNSIETWLKNKGLL